MTFPLSITLRNARTRSVHYSRSELEQPIPNAVVIISPETVNPTDTRTFEITGD